MEISPLHGPLNEILNFFKTRYSFEINGKTEDVVLPSGEKCRMPVCKTVIRQFKSGQYLQNKKDIRKDVLFVLERREDRFEKLNAARMSAAADGSTEANNNFSSYREEKCKQIWPVPHD